MATEVTVKIRDNPLGQAFLVQPEEWDLCLSEIRSILTSQEVETPFEYRFLTSNGNVVSSALEKNMTFRDIVEREPFAEVKKEDTSLQSAEERVTTQICLISVGESGNSSDEQTEIKCPLLKKIPHLLAVKDSIPCMRNAFNVNTLLKVAFILTCLLFLMVFVLMLFLHIVSMPTMTCASI
ncbi:hypothetical protein PoB_001777100 [Plakobranchus ocellatus]|uniref:Ubiquitin-like domain-containing protein n=1 Tax=Plakobranchus ocellatus TaxID=259542 RepID=A0AAV3YVX0_9GAST|nr:hypothetical protein PoB_001777100 [Plakobranchus ocellatus]